MLPLPVLSEDRTASSTLLLSQSDIILAHSITLLDLTYLDLKKHDFTVFLTLQGHRFASRYCIAVCAKLHTFEDWTVQNDSMSRISTHEQSSFSLGSCLLRLWINFGIITSSYIDFECASPAFFPSSIKYVYPCSRRE